MKMPAMGILSLRWNMMAVATNRPTKNRAVIAIKPQGSESKVLLNMMGKRNALMIRTKVCQGRILQGPFSRAGATQLNI